MQTTNNILMVRPASFGFNIETAASNVFQNKAEAATMSLHEKSLLEFDAVVQKLREKGMHVIVVNDSQHPIKPDAIFPNNWATYHAAGTVVVYPMLAENRRAERRQEIIDQIGEVFEVKKIIDLSVYEKEKRFLEGTGSIVFDHKNKIAYACVSPRTNKNLFVEYCEKLDYRPVIFNSVDVKGNAIYHTNVMMNIGNGYAVICLESITNEKEKEVVTDSLINAGLEIIEISLSQIVSFCGNMLELEIINGKNILALSQTAFDNLNAQQKERLTFYCELFQLSIPTIESIGGGSIRCMIAEIFLPKKEKPDMK